jgi:hypothetical protein
MHVSWVVRIKLGYLGGQYKLWSLMFCKKVNYNKAVTKTTVQARGNILKIALPSVGLFFASSPATMH